MKTKRTKLKYTVSGERSKGFCIMDFCKKTQQDMLLSQSFHSRQRVKKRCAESQSYWDIVWQTHIFKTTKHGKRKASHSL